MALNQGGFFPSYYMAQACMHKTCIVMFDLLKPICRSSLWSCKNDISLDRSRLFFLFSRTFLSCFSQFFCCCRCNFSFMFDPEQTAIMNYWRSSLLLRTMATTAATAATANEGIALQRLRAHKMACCNVLFENEQRIHTRTHTSCCYHWKTNIWLMVSAHWFLIAAYVDCVRSLSLWLWLWLWRECVCAYLIKIKDMLRASG